MLPGGGTDAIIALAIDAVANSDDGLCLRLCRDGAVKAHGDEAVAYRTAMMTASVAAVRKCRRGMSSEDREVVFTLWPMIYK